MVNKCLICDSENLSGFNKANIDFIECANCKVVYHKFLPDELELKKYYSNEYKIAGNKHSDIYSEYRRMYRLPEQIKLISEMKNIIPENSSILDIGSDRGAFIDEARRWGYNVAGVEPSLSAREYCKQVGLQVYSDLNEVEGNFNVATLWHSLEHFTEPDKLFKLINNKLQKEVFIFIRVPAYDSIWRKIFGSKWIWFQPQNHYFHYTVPALKKLLIKNGYEIVLIRKQYPNDRLTNKSKNTFKNTFRVTFDLKFGLKKLLGEIIEKVTGMEIFAIAKKIQ